MNVLRSLHWQAVEETINSYRCNLVLGEHPCQFRTLRGFDYIDYLYLAQANITSSQQTYRHFYMLKIKPSKKKKSKKFSTILQQTSKNVLHIVYITMINHFLYNIFHSLVSHKSKLQFFTSFPYISNNKNVLVLSNIYLNFPKIWFIYRSIEYLQFSIFMRR